MNSSQIRSVVFSPWLPHSLCCVVVLLACVPILWPEIAGDIIPVSAARYAGHLLLGAILASAALLCAGCVHHLLNMRNLRALWQLLVWLLLWGLTAFIFTQMAIEADVDSPFANETVQPIQQTTTLHPPTEKLTSPSSLELAIDPELYSDKVLESAANLVKLESEHEEILASFLKKAPRWAFSSDDNIFYTKPGHVVLVPPATGGIPGTVHATFRTVTEGERLPDGFVIATPGGEFPTTADGTMPDIALELSGKHYLLLAWRGTKHLETARKAINAAIAAIDTRMERLAKNPTEESAAHLREGRRSYPGNKPELRLNEPDNQYGVYQAEVYANTGKPGTMLLVIRDISTGKPLRLFTFPARYSSNPNELFRHDIPGTPEEWMASAPISEAGTIFPQGAPYFAICTGESHQYFGVTFEVQFFPQGKDGTSATTLLRRNYKVQAYETSPEQ